MPILDIRYGEFLQSGEETFELQGGKNKSLTGSLGIVI